MDLTKLIDLIAEVAAKNASREKDNREQASKAVAFL